MQQGISMETVEGVGEFKFSHDEAIWRGFDEASGGMDSCLTSSWNANAKLSGDEVDDKFGGGEIVRAWPLVCTIRNQRRCGGYHQTFFKCK